MKLGLSPCSSSPLGCEYNTYKRALELGNMFDEKGGEGAITSLIHEKEQFAIIFFNNFKIFIDQINTAFLLKTMFQKFTLD